MTAPAYGEAMDVVDALDAAYEHGQVIFTGVREEQMHDPTPCPLFDVAQLVEHAIGVMDLVTTGIGGEAGDAAGGAPSDPGAAFTGAARRSLAAWRGVGSMDATVTMPWGESTMRRTAEMALTDVLAHTWDLAAATGQPRQLPAEPAAIALDFARGMLQPHFRAERPDAAFGPEVAVPDDASVSDRLIGWLGRDPAR